ncbi:MAG: RES family NAD+ phosphorylase [Elusimicrobia bacterium]|nr:RES family NAD+ phosphorylase [Candidatus Liberimonas magnetica]
MNKDNKIEKYRKIVQPQIEYCLNCQARDSGEWVWVLGDRTDLEELFCDYDVPDNLRNDLADKLVCNNCGTQLSRGIEIGLMTKAEREFHDKLAKWRKYYEKRFRDFLLYLEKYPFLGGQHKIGKIICENIKLFPTTEIINEEWCRARKIVSGRKLTKKDMDPPNPLENPIFEGRYNHFGQSHFYLSSQPEAAAKEILDNEEVFVNMQKILIEKASNILDLRDWWEGEDRGLPVIPMGLILSDLFQKDVDRKKNWKPEYFITRYIADVAKMNGYQGIIFQSKHHYYNNMVLFEPKLIKYKFIDEPYIYELKNNTDFEVTDWPFRNSK